MGVYFPKWMPWQYTRHSLSAAWKFKQTYHSCIQDHVKQIWFCMPWNCLRSQNFPKNYQCVSGGNSTGASGRSFYPIFNKRFDHLETLLTICRPKKVLSAGSLCGPLVPSPQSKCPKRTFMLPQKYHVSVSNMLSKPLKCFM